MNSDDLIMVIDNIEKKDFWHKTMTKITLGFMMTLMILKLGTLGYALPIIGAMFLYSGFKDLRNENKELNVAWIFSIINMVLQVMNLIYLSTPLNINFKHMGIKIFISMVFQISFLIIFRIGLKKIFHNAKVKPKKDPILGLIIWNIIFIICAITELGKTIYISIPVIIAYCYLLNSLYKLKYDLETINYMTLKNKKRFAHGNILLYYALGCIFVVVVSCVTSNHIKLNPKEVSASEASEIRRMLIDKGFPVHILNDIDDKDVERLKEAKCVENFSEKIKFKENPKLEKNKLIASSIFIEMNDKAIYSIQHFNWENGGAYWRDEISVSAILDLKLISGKLLYENEGVTYIADMPQLNDGVTTTSNFFGHVLRDNKIIGRVNYPFNSKQQRGYMFYRLNPNETSMRGVQNAMRYIHYETPFRIPYTEVEHKNLIVNDNLGVYITRYEGNIEDKIDEQI